MSASFDALVGAVVPSELEADVKDILVTIGLVDTMASQAWDRCGRMVAVVFLVGRRRRRLVVGLFTIYMRTPTT